MAKNKVQAAANGHQEAELLRAMWVSPVVTP